MEDKSQMNVACVEHFEKIYLDTNLTKKLYYGHTFF